LHHLQRNRERHGLQLRQASALGGTVQRAELGEVSVKWDFDQLFLSSKWEVSKEHVNFISENEMARKK